MAGTESSKQTPQRGRIDKRQAILDAAFTVFAREGYGGACVKEIAAEAGVAKPTVYNHLNDKETLFRHAVTAAAEAVLAENLAAVERLHNTGDDVRAALEDMAVRLLRVYCGDRASALRRLVAAEAAKFPDLLEVAWGTRTNRVTEALADRLARLTLTGHLSLSDATEAAEQLTALLTGPAETRSRFGTRRVPATELRAVAQSAVRTFLQAFGAAVTIH